MILIPRLKTVVILVPRTGSGSLYRAVLDKYPDAMMLYRHMEADGVPRGYDRWRKVGVVRDPLERLWSLYKYLRRIVENPETLPYDPQGDILDGWRRSLVPFNEYIRFNESTFPLQHRSVGDQPGTFDPRYACNCSIPENRKSQFVYLRPDLGTQVFRYETELDDLQELLGIKMGLTNKSDDDPMPSLSAETIERVQRVFEWEYETLAYPLPCDV
jgi:hypothetical protein